jgi:chromosome segregation ATPase
MTHATRSARPLLLAVLLASGGLAGCDRGTEAQTAVRNAGHKFGSISADVTAHSTASYDEIVRSMQDHAGNTDGYAEAAAVTLAQAHLGQAAQAAQESAAAEAESTRRVRVIRGSLSEYITLTAVAEAASRFDATTDLSEISGLLTTRRQDAATYESQKAEIDAQIADLMARIADLRSQAGQERALAGELGLQMTSVNATRAAEIAAEAREHTLRADQFDLEAQRIEGRVGQLRPSAAEIGLNVQKASSQIEQLLSAQRELQARGRAAQTDAAEARAAAAQARERLGAMARELAAFRQEQVGPKADRVGTLISQAQGALRDAGSVVQASAAATRTSIAEVTGSVWARRAAGQNEAASIFEALAAAGVPGPMAENAKAEREAAAESATQAKESFRSAAEALRSIRARGAAADEVAAAAVRLDRLAGIEPEVIPESEPMPDDAVPSEDTEGADGTEVTLEDLLADLPEEVRETVRGQIQSQLDMLSSIDDPEILRATLEQLDAQAETMPAETAPAFDFARRVIQQRIDELEGGR